jgi:uncharacterized alpha-E superfamily protein
VRLLSRNAEALFWLARYLERGASLARVIEMQSSFGGHAQEGGWNWLLALHADDERFRKDHEPSSANIVAFYTIDLGNGGSIRSSIHWARENARSLRPFIPLEMWVQLNAFYADVEHLTARDIEPAMLPRTCARIRAGCLAQIGIADGTLFRDEAYLFFRLGLMLERADQTSRLLDVKFAQAASTPHNGDVSSEFVFWSTILRTAAAHQVFQRLEQGGVSPERVARFLILNPSHPRSIGFCVRSIGEALAGLRGAFQLSATNACLERYEVLTEALQAVAADQRFATHLHDFNDWVQRSLMELTAEISRAFFLAPAPTEPPAEPARPQSQSQSHSSGTQVQQS